MFLIFTSPKLVSLQGQYVRKFYVRQQLFSIILKYFYGCGKILFLEMRMNDPYKFGLMLCAIITALFIGFFPHIFHWALIYILALMAVQLIVAVHALLDWRTAHWRLVELRMETNYKLEGIEHALNQIAIYAIANPDYLQTRSVNRHEEKKDSHKD